ncbi:hypothetical protein V8E53_014156 [Lactarius tabidus]
MEFISTLSMLVTLTHSGILLERLQEKRFHKIRLNRISSQPFEVLWTHVSIPTSNLSPPIMQAKSSEMKQGASRSEDSSFEEEMCSAFWRGVALLNELQSDVGQHQGETAVLSGPSYMWRDFLWQLGKFHIIGIGKHIMNKLDLAINLGSQIPTFFEFPYYPSMKLHTSFMLYIWLTGGQ